MRGSSPIEMDGARIRLPAGRVTQSRRLPRREIAAPQAVDLGEGRVRFLGSGLEPADAVKGGQAWTVVEQIAVGDMGNWRRSGTSVSLWFSSIRGIAVAGSGRRRRSRSR